MVNWLETAKQIKDVMKEIFTINTRIKELEEKIKVLESQTKHIELSPDVPVPGERCPTCGKATVRLFTTKENRTTSYNTRTGKKTTALLPIKRKKCTDPNCSYDEEIK